MTDGWGSTVMGRSITVNSLIALTFWSYLRQG